MAPSSSDLNRARTKAQEFMAIMHSGVAKAQEESRRLGIPNVYSIDGQLYYELPNGELSLENLYLASREQNGFES